MSAMFSQTFHEVAMLHVKRRCSIFSKLDGSANGVFVGDGHIVTAAHVVRGFAAVIAENMTGRAVLMKPAYKGGRHVINEYLDLALIELEKPIAEAIALPPVAGGKTFPAISLDPTLILKTRFAGIPSAYPTHIDGFTTKSGRKDEPNLSDFTMAVKAVPGYSGSPVFEKEGSTLVSVLAAGSTVEQERAIKDAKDFNSFFGRHIPIQPRIPFVGVRPDIFANWFANASAHLRLV